MSIYTCVFIICRYKKSIIFINQGNIMRISRVRKLLCVCALAAISYQVAAADQTNFTGFTMGLTAGMSRNTVDYSGYIGNQSPSKNDFVGGANIGYGFALGQNFVLTVGAAFDLNSTKFANTTYQNGGSTVGVSGKLKDHWSVFVAPGVRLDPRWLAYAKVGYHHAKSEYTDALVGSGSTSHHGIGYGAGLAYAATRNVELKAEVQHVSLNRGYFALSSGKPSVTQLNVGANIRF